MKLQRSEETGSENIGLNKNIELELNWNNRKKDQILGFNKYWISSLYWRYYKLLIQYLLLVGEMNI